MKTPFCTTSSTLLSFPASLWIVLNVNGGIPSIGILITQVHTTTTREALAEPTADTL